MRLERGALCVMVGALLGSLALAAPAGAFERQWSVPQPQGNTLRSVAFIDALHGCTIGARGAILTTDDGGLSWTDRTSFETHSQNMNDVLALPGGALLAVGSSPGIFRSVDGGVSWSAVANPSTVELVSLAWMDGTTLSAVGASGQALRSLDGGSTWTLRPVVGSFEAVDQFWKNPSDGFVLGDSQCRRTTDGGATWNNVAGINGTFFFSGDIAFTDASNGWIAVDFTTWRTTNGGASWFQKHGTFGQAPIYQQEGYFFDASHRLMTTGAEGSEIWETFDDGLHWTQRYLNQESVGFSAITRLPSGALVVVGSGGQCLRSPDGVAWTDLTGRPNQLFIPLETYAHVPGGRTFAGGWKNALLESQDGGLSYTVAADNPEFALIWDIDFANSQIGLIGGSVQPATQSAVARTSDGGLTWERRTVVGSYAGSPIDVEIFPSGVAWAALWGGSSLNFVYRSTDSGLTWTQRTDGIAGNSRLNCLDALDDQSAFAAGGDFGDLTVYGTTNAGLSWTTLPDAGVNGSGVRAMKWFDSQTGVVATDAGIFRTTNRGVSWSQRASGFVTSMHFEAQRGIAGDPLNPLIYLSDDSGLTWSRFDTGLEYGPSRVYVDGPRRIVLGSETTILRLEENPAAVEPQLVVPTGLAMQLLSANPTRGEVSLLLTRNSSSAGSPVVSLHDAAGRLAARLDPATTASGTWRYDLDLASRGLPAGVYWLRAEMDGAATGRSIVLVR